MDTMGGDRMSCPCTRPTNGWLCTACLAELRTNIRRIPDVLVDLQTTKTRQDVHGGNGGGHSTGSKPPLNLTAMTVHLDLEVMLRTMYGHAGGTEGVTDYVMAKFITFPRCYQRLTAKPCVIEYAHQLPRLLDQATTLIDTPANTVRVGTCPTPHCGTELTARENDTDTTCPTCGHTHNIHTTRLHRILQALGDNGQPVRASEAVRRFNKAGLTLTTKDVENWVRRGHLHPTTTDEHQRRLYNLTDMYTTYTEQAS